MRNDTDKAFHVGPRSPISLWGQVQQDLQRRIERGEFSPREKLPSETAFAAHYRVSRATIRRSLQPLIESGHLHARRGSGTYVSDRVAVPRFDVSLLRPWREQLLATGHIARPRLVNRLERQQLPTELASLVEYDRHEKLTFGLHVQEVDGIAIAANESWFPVTDQGITMQRKPSSIVSASCFVGISSASVFQAELLDIPAGTALLEVTACSRLRETGELVELARTSWVPSRINLTYTRALTAGQIDMSELLSFQRDEDE